MGGTQVLEFGRQVLYNLSHTPALHLFLIKFFFFLRRVLGFELKVYTLSHPTSPFL
jgi:hypothetical protein